MVQFFEAQRYNLEGREFASLWCHWNFSLTYSFRSHYGPGVDSASNRMYIVHYGDFILRVPDYIVTIMWVFLVLCLFLYFYV